MNIVLLALGLSSPKGLMGAKGNAPMVKPMLGARVAAASAFAACVMPVVALAEEVSSEIDYGSVSAPDFILPLGAVLAIATALLPVVLKSGDDAAREMQERDADTFGKTMDSVGGKKKPRK